MDVTASWLFSLAPRLGLNLGGDAEARKADRGQPAGGVLRAEPHLVHRCVPVASQLHRRSLANAS